MKRPRCTARFWVGGKRFQCPCSGPPAMRREDETLCAYHDTNYRHHAKTADYTRDKASIDRFRAKCSLEVARDLVASAKQLIDSVKVSEED